MKNSKSTDKAQPTMTGIDDLLVQLRAAKTADEYTAVMTALEAARTDISDLRLRMDAAEDKAIFSGDDPAVPRETVRQCDDDLRTIEMALTGAERRRAECAVRENATAMSALGDEAAKEGKELSLVFKNVRLHLEAARAAIIAADELTRSLDAKHDTLMGAGRRDLAVNASRIRREALGAPLPALPRVNRTLRDALSVVDALATGKRPWSPGLSAVSPIIGAQSTPNPVDGERPLRRSVA